jgi:hypothetical protein
VYDNSKPGLKSASLKICGAWLPLSKKTQRGFKGETPRLRHGFGYKVK